MLARSIRIIAFRVRLNMEYCFSFDYPGRQGPFGAPVDEPIASEPLVTKGILVTDFAIDINRSCWRANERREMRRNRMSRRNAHSMPTVRRDNRARHVKSLRWWVEADTEGMRFNSYSCPLAHVVGRSTPAILDFNLRDRKRTLKGNLRTAKTYVCSQLPLRCIDSNLILVPKGL